MKAEEGQGQGKRKKSKWRRTFALCSFFILDPSSFVPAVHHDRAGQNVQTFLLVLDLG